MKKQVYQRSGSTASILYRSKFDISKCVFFDIYYHIFTLFKRSEKHYMYIHNTFA